LARTSSILDMCFDLLLALVVLNGSLLFGSLHLFQNYNSSVSANPASIIYLFAVLVLLNDAQKITDGSRIRASIMTIKVPQARRSKIILAAIW
jgi:hypothetical protein